MIEVSNTREIARAYDRAHAERAQAFKKMFRLPRVNFHVPLGWSALTAPSR